MQATIPTRLFRNLTFLLLASSLGACSWEGDGPTRIPGTPAPEIPPGFCDVINFENFCGPFTLQDFAGGATQIVDNPDKRGLNTSDKVVRMWKFQDQVFGGTTLLLNDSIDFANGRAFTMKVWSPRAVPVLFKLEPTGDVQRSVNHSGSGSWEQLCFDFAGSTAGLNANGITVIFDLGVMGNANNDIANWTFFFDEIEQVADCGVLPAPTVLPVNFEGAGPYVFNDFEGAVAAVISNPVSGGINTSAQVAQMRKFAGATFAGSTLVLDEPVNFSRGAAIRMKVWSPRSVPVLFKFEGLDQERTVSHGGGSAWQELCFDFTGSTAGPATSAITFIFDNGVAGNAEADPANWTFYFDDITQSASCGGGGADPGIIPDAVVYASDPNVTVDLPPPVVDDLDSGSTFDFFFAGDADFKPALRVISSGGGGGGGGIDGNIVINGGFETGTFDGWQRFENNGVLNIVTNNPSSGTYAANLVVPVRGLPLSAADPLIKNPNLQAGNLTPGAQVTVSFDMRGTLSGAGGVVFAELFSELAGEGVSKAEILSGGPLEPTAGWTTYSFTTTLGPDVSGGVTLQLKASCGPVEGCGVDVFVDNVSIVLGTGGAGGAGGGAATFAFASADAGANVGIIALSGYDPGFAAGFETFDFKVKGLPTSTIEVRFIGGGDTSRVYNVTSYAGSTALGNGWYQLSIPMTDFAATIAGNQGFVLGPLGEQAAPFSFLLTDIGFSGTAGGGGEVGDNIVVNGGFETGTFEGWETFAGGGIQAIVTDNPSSGTYAANLAVPVRGPTDAGMDNLIKNSNLQAGNLTPGAQVTVSFDMRGTLSGAGGVVFAEFFSELSGGGTSKAEILSGGPLAPTAGWTKYSYNTTLGSDVSGGVTLQLKASCGPVEGCGVDVFFDNVSIVIGGGVEPPPTGDGVAIDFDGDGPFNFIDFEGGVATVLANPDPSGINTSAQVARMQKFEGAPFAGSTLPLASAVDFSAGPAFTMKVWSSRPVPVTFKLEGLGQERVANHSGGSVWQELCFDFTGSTAGMPANGITFIFDNGTVGDAQNDPGNWTFYFDAIKQVSGCTAAPPPPVGNFPTITFDDPSVTYTLTDFGGNASVITNDPTGGSNQVVQIIRGGGAQDWAGTTVSTLADLAVPVIPFTASETRMTVRVYSPDAGIPVVLKVEDVANDTIFVETLATTTVANEWEILTFDFASPRPSTPSLNLANTYNKLSIFFNFGTDGATAGEKIYYFDDIAFGGDVAGNIAINGGFETGTFEGWETIPGGGTQTIVTNNPSSGTYAANLFVPVRTQADPAVDNLIKNSNLQAGNLTPGDLVTVSFDLRGTLSGAGGVVFAEFFSERAGEGTSKAEILGGGPLVPTADWATCSFNTTLGPDVDGGVTLLLKTSCGPVEGCGVDAFFDNVSIVIGTEGDGGGCGGGGGGGGGDDGGGIWDGGGIAVNGGFETGTFDGWETFPGGGIQTIVTNDPSSGTYAANLFVPVRTQADPAVDNLIKNSNLQAGNLTPGDLVTVSFDLRGTLSGAGGVVFAELFSELAGEGTSKSVILGGEPLVPTPGWRKYSFDTTLGPDVGGGVTLQLKASCGPVEGCGVDAFFDNVSIVIN